MAEDQARPNNEAIINGKKVVFRDRFAVRESRDLPKLFAACGPTDEDHAGKIVVMRRCIESWEFGGDPKQAESYEELDIFAELFPLMKALGEYVVSRMGLSAEQAKNLASAFSSR